MHINNRNHKNPTVRAWESLKLLLQSFADRLNRFDDMTQRQGRDIGIDEVYNEIQNIRKELDSIQNSLNLYNGTISQGNKGVNPTDLQGESKSFNNKARLSESQLHQVIKECVKNVLNEVKVGNYSLHGDNAEDWSVVEKLRDCQMDDMPESELFSSKGRKPSRASLRNNANAAELYREKALNQNPYIHYDDFQKGWQHMRNKANQKLKDIINKN